MKVVNEQCDNTIKCIDTFSADIFNPNEEKKIIDIPCLNGVSGQKTICIEFSDEELQKLKTSKQLIVTFLPHYLRDNIALLPLFTINQ